jgi:hypothetical protein
MKSIEKGRKDVIENTMKVDEKKILTIPLNVKETLIKEMKGMNIREEESIYRSIEVKVSLPPLYVMMKLV